MFEKLQGGKCLQNESKSCILPTQRQGLHIYTNNKLIHHMLTNAFYFYGFYFYFAGQAERDVACQHQ